MPKDDLKKSAQVVVPLNPPSVPPGIPIPFVDYKTHISDQDACERAMVIANANYFNFEHGEWALAQEYAAREPKNLDAIKRRTKAHERLLELRADVYHWGRQLDEAKLKHQRKMAENLSPYRDRREIQHGTRSGYVTDGCRCAPCRNAHAEYQRQWKEKTRS